MNVNVDLLEEIEIQINAGIMVNVNMSICKKRHLCEKDYVWNHATCNCENGKYLASIMDNSVTMCDADQTQNLN